MVVSFAPFKSMLCLAAAGVLAVSGAARAAYVYTVWEVPFSTTVRIDGEGSLNLTDLTFQGNGFISSTGILPSTPHFVFGAAGMASYYGSLSGPAQLGPSSFTSPPADQSLGSLVGISGSALIVSSSYVSGSYLSNQTMYFNQTIAGLGLVPGSYVWTWGIGVNADSLTINVVPEPSTYALMALGAGAVLWAMRRRRVA